MNKEPQWMHCTTCKSLVYLNETGICLGCQRGFSTNSPDKYKTEAPQSQSYGTTIQPTGKKK